MIRSLFVPGALALGLMSIPAEAANDADLDAIRSEIRDLKQSYEARIQALEQRLKEAEAKSAAPAPVAVAAPATSNSTSFNPAISAILTGTYAHLSQDPANFTIPGFTTGGESGPGQRSFSLGESELTLSANVDPHFAGVLTVAVTPEDTIGVEEAYGLYLTAPYGMAPKFGRFLSGIGYMNEQHAHAWDFVDAPLAYQAFLGGQHRTDGLQVKWVAPIDQYVELGAEIGSSDAVAAYAHTGGDIGDRGSWRAGVSYLKTTSSDDGVDATSRVTVADFVWKYAPTGNSRDASVKVQGEYFDGRIREAVRQTGWYLQGVYQFMPEWRVGARIERLDPRGADDVTYAPRKATLMLDYNASEFSRIRLQLARSQMAGDLTDNQVFLQYILSLGAHGAHRY